MKRFLLSLLFLLTSSLFPLTSLAQAQRQFKSLTADFVQTKTSKMLNDKVVSKGRLTMIGDNIRMEIDGKVWDNTQANGTQGKFVREIARFVASNAALTSDKPSQDVALSKSMKRMYKKITLFFNPHTRQVERLVMYGKKGDITEIALKNVTIR